MRRFSTLLLLMVLFICSKRTYGQYGIPYQAIARGTSGAILANQAVGLRFSIRDSTASGPVLYTETFSVTTDAEGLFNVNVGMGTVVTGNFNTISWGAGAKFMQMEMDQTGGSSYNNLGTQQLMAVPYALFAKNGLPPGTTGEVLYHDGVNWQKLAPGAPNTTLGMKNGIPKWMTRDEASTPNVQTISPEIIGINAVRFRVNVIDRGYGNSYQQGVIWGTTRNIEYTTANLSYPQRIMATTTLGISSMAVSGFLPNTKYYFRAIATNLDPVNNGNWRIANGHVDSFTTNPTLVMGQNYQGGKIVFLTNTTPAGVYDPFNLHGIIAATDDLPGTYQWGCFGTLVSGQNTNMYGGGPSTALIAAACGPTSAAAACLNLVYNGYDDWVLPNWTEQSYVNSHRTILGLTSGNYLTSTQPAPPAGNNQVGAYSYPAGSGIIINKNIAAKVRPVRYF